MNLFLILFVSGLCLLWSGLSLLSLVWMRRLSRVACPPYQVEPQPLPAFEQLLRDPTPWTAWWFAEDPVKRLWREPKKVEWPEWVAKEWEKQLLPRELLHEQSSKQQPSSRAGQLLSLETYTWSPVEIPREATQVKAAVIPRPGMEPVLLLDFLTSTGPSGGPTTTPAVEETPPSGPTPSKTSESAGASTATTSPGGETAGPAGH